MSGLPAAHFKRVRARLFTASAGLAIALLLGRLTGLLRESAMAARFGISGEGDIAVILLALPDLLVNLLVAGGVSAALVPRLAAATPQEGEVLTRFVALATAAIFGFIGLIVAFSPQAVFHVFAPGLAGSMQDLRGWVPVLVGVAIPIAALSGIGGAFLNARNRFFAVGIGTLLFNAGVIASLLLWARGDSALLAMAWGILVGALLRWTPQLPLLPSGLFKPGRVLPAGWRPFTADFLAGLIATTITLLPPIVIRAIASFLGSGEVVSVNYAQKLIELPVGVLFSAIGTVTLTATSHAHHRGGQEAAIDAALPHLRRTVLLGIVSASVSVCFARPVVEVLYGYGRMNVRDVQLVAELFRIGALSIPFAGVAILGTNVLYATGRAKKALVPSAIALVLAPLACIPALATGETPYLMFAVVVAQAVLAATMLWRSGISLLPHGKHPGAGLIDRRTIRVAGASLIPIVLSAILYAQLSAPSPLVSLTLAGAAFIAGGAIIFFRRDAS